MGRRYEIKENQNPKYQAILKLDILLNERGIPHELVCLLDGWKIAYPDNANCIFDAIQHHYSYGSKKDLLEIWGENIEDVIGYQSVETALDMFIKVHGGKGHKRSGKEERKKYYTFFVDTNGARRQQDKALEEMAELQKAILKHREKSDKEAEKAIIDEIADVSIMLEQLKIIYSCTAEVEERIDFKIDRQLKRILGEHNISE